MSSDERERSHKLLSKIRDGATFLDDAGDAFKGSGIAQWLSSSSEIADAAFESAAETFKIVKFVTTFLAKITGDNPTVPKLAFVACATAYQQSLYEAIALVGPPSHDDFTEQVRIGLNALASADTVDFETLSYDNLLGHPFIRIADDATEVYAKYAGYDETQRTHLMGTLHRMYGRKLRLLIGNPKLREKFAPLADFLQMKGTGVAAHEFLERHARYQRALYERAPLLKIEPFALKDVYIDTECGKLPWDDLRKGLTGRAGGAAFDPFSEECGGRQSLLDTVLGFIAHPEFNDAIVVQGVAGAGKSSFTLRLSVALQDRGLLPIRIPLRSLAVDDPAQPFGEALARAIRVSDDRTEVPSVSVREAFAAGTLFEETVPYGATRVCPYVLIFDGWDEISISASEGFRQRVETVLSNIRSKFLEPGRGRVRVILTGRPSQDVNETGFFRATTPVLTVRHMKREDLQQFVNRVRASLEDPPLRNQVQWTLPDDEALAPVLAAYAQSFEKKERDGTMDVLGLPLLAHIALRLFGVWQGSLADLVTNPTKLYRSLVDITCDKGGQPKTDDLEIERKARLAPDQLRKLLRDTAIAITVYGTDNIPSAELERRLRSSFHELEASATAAAKYPFSSLMINFFFKGGYRELGCEFLHKSFREYLYAEGVIEILKRYANDHRELPPERPRDQYWKEFALDDPRYQLSQDLMEALAAQWITPEVDGHLWSLIEWEISRAAGDDESPVGTPTERLTLEQWCWIRDVLADLWDWWGEGTPMRPQPRITDGKTEFQRSRLDALVEWCAPPVVRGMPYSKPPRVTALDAHLGDALFRLNVAIHASLAFNTGWTAFERSPAEMWEGLQIRGDQCRRYQSRIVQDDRMWTMFAPSGEDSLYFRNYASRINAAGFRLAPFPLGLKCWALDLASTDLTVAYGLFATSWRYCNLAEVNWEGSNFESHEMISVYARFAVFLRSTFARAILDWSDFSDAALAACDFAGASVYRLDVRGAATFRVSWLRARHLETVLSDEPLPQKR